MRSRPEPLLGWLSRAIGPVVAAVLAIRFVVGIASDAARAAPAGPVDRQILTFAAFDFVAIAMAIALSWFVLRRPVPAYPSSATRPELRGRDAVDSPLWDRDLDS